MSGTVSPPRGFRTYGRVIDPTSGVKWWVQVNPDENGYNDSIYLTTLVQCMRLNWGESPFYGDWGIPAQQSVVTQIFPDYYMMLMQSRFSPYFLSLIIVRQPPTAQNYFQSVAPVYDVYVQMQNGAQISTTIIPLALVDGFGQVITDGNGYPISVGTQTGKFVPDAYPTQPAYPVRPG